MDSNENPVPRQRKGWTPPLTCEDGAARVLHPIRVGLSGKKQLFGVVLKNYVLVAW